MKTKPEAEMKTEEKTTETTTPAPCNPLPPAFALRHAGLGEVISHGQDMKSDPGIENPPVEPVREKPDHEAQCKASFLLADGQSLSEGDAHWCEGLLKREDVANAVTALADSLNEKMDMSGIVECQRNFISLAADLNWDCDPYATPGKIKAVLSTWKYFHDFLSTQGAQPENA